MIGFVCVMHKCKNCSRNSFNTINRFVKSLYKHCREDFTLYLYDNESDEKFNLPKYNNIKYTYVEDQSIKGLYVLNDGIEEAIKDNCEIILLVNDDLVFNKTINNFVDIIRNHEDKDISLFGPLTNGVRSVSKQLAYCSSSGIEEITNLKRPYSILNGFCLAFTKKFYYNFRSENGNICESPDKWSGGEIRLWRRIKENKGKIFIVKDCWIFHKKMKGWKSFMEL